MMTWPSFLLRSSKGKTEIFPAFYRTSTIDFPMPCGGAVSSNRNILKFAGFLPHRAWSWDAACNDGGILGTAPDIQRQRKTLARGTRNKTRLRKSPTHKTCFLSRSLRLQAKMTPTVHQHLWALKLHQVSALIYLSGPPKLCLFFFVMTSESC